MIPGLTACAETSTKSSISPGSAAMRSVTSSSSLKTDAASW